MKCFAFALLAIAALVSAQEPNCENPLADALGIDLPSQPIVGADSDICPHFKSTDPVCCTNEAFAVIDAEFERAYDQMRLWHAEMSGIADSLADNEPGPVFVEGTTVYNQTPELAKAMNQFIEDTWDLQIQFFQDLPDALLKCYRAIFRYLAGIYCFLCDANYSRYLNEEGTHVTLKVAQAVCDELVEGCVGVWKLLADFFEDLIQIFVNLFSDLHDAYPDIFGEVNEENYENLFYTVCESVNDAQCADVICSGVNGFDNSVGYTMDEVQTFNNFLPARKAAVERANDAPPTTQRLAHILLNVADVSQTTMAMRRLVPRIHEEGAVDTLNTLVRRLDNALRAGHHAIHSRQSGSVSNEYTAEGGYEATEVGEETPMYEKVDDDISKEVGGNDGGSTSAAATLAASFLAGVGAIAALV